MQELKHSAPRQLARVMGLASSSAGLWRPEELDAILQYQMSERFETSIVGEDPSVAMRCRILRQAEDAMIRNFGDLFQHPNPPLGLLQTAKEYAKYTRQNPNSSIPPEVSSLLYLMTIATALVRYSKKISSLDPKSLSEGFAWALQQSWVSEPVKALFLEAKVLLCAAPA